ncbi:MAG: S8 family serine peptidase, partial [Melioribacteraceae bacterium]|nr:S8 family serine peptidase [Melioribacteraceae bacterium]
ALPISFYFDDGAHGTHCAGISAGNKISDTEFYGVAPGAYVIGLKLGNNNYSGGATVAESMKKAYLYADQVSKERQEPCIINMSFGVGAEIEGQSDIELFLKDLVNKNPYLYIATSNGNEGPGLSTAGMPSTSSDIFSSGAVLSKEVGNDLYGTTLDRDIILHFSSRGGEVSKPDVVAPGASVSTVPNFSKGDKMWGTSMASPYSAGVMSVLLGAFKIEFPDVKIPSKLLYKALRESADPMQGYNYLDQGGGLINLEKAYTLLKKYIQNGEIDNFETYTITSFAPNMPKNIAPNIYIRDGSYLSGSETFTFKVMRNNFNNIANFHRSYNLTSDSDWLKVVQKNVHIRHDQTVYVNAKIDESILNQPGLYNAKIVANRADKSNVQEFDLMTTIIIPYEFNPKNEYSQDFTNEKILPGMHKRYFLKIPAGTSNLNITVESGKKEYTSVRYYLHDADGREKLFGTLDAKSENGKKVNYLQELEPGIYEFVILGQYTSEKESIFDLSFEIDGINILDEAIISEGTIEAVNYFSKVKTYDLNGKVMGYQKSFMVQTNSKKNYELPFNLKEGDSKITFDISLEKEMFNKVTDFAMMIYDENGNAEASGGLTYKDGSISIKRAKKDGLQNYKLVIVPGYANEPSNIDIKITKKIYFTDQPEIKFIVESKNKLTLYPFINYKIKYEYKLPTVTIPEGYNYFGEISFKSNKSNEVEFSKIIKINN